MAGVKHKDWGVSEVVGTMLVFAIVVSAFSAFELWYVPNTQTAYEQEFQSASQASLASLISQLESPSLKTGSLISQNVPLGIQGSLFTPSRATSISFSHSGFNATLSYSGGVDYKLLENTVPTAITNEVVGTFPKINGNMPLQIAVAPNGMIYVVDYASNSLTEINPATHSVVGTYYCGLNPVGITVGSNGNLYISNFFSFINSGGAGYSTITVFSTSTNTIVGTINANGYNTNLLYPSGLFFAPSKYSSSYGYIYAAVETATGTPGLYTPGIIQVNTSTNSISPISESISSRVLEINNLAYYHQADSGMTYVWITDFAQNSISNLTILPSGKASNIVHIYSSNLMNPFGIVYDSVNGHFYVTDSPSLLGPNGLPRGSGYIFPGEAGKGNVTIYARSGGAGQLIPVNASEPAGIATSSQSGYVYVGGYAVAYNTTTFHFYSPIIAINGVKESDTSSINLNGSMQFMEGFAYLSYDSSSGLLLVSGNVSNNNIIISGLTTTPLQHYVWNNPFSRPDCVVYISGTSYLAVANAGTNSIVILNAFANNTVVARYDVGEQPVSIAYNPVNGYLYVANTLSQNVTIINPVLSNPSHGHVVANVSLPTSSTNLFGNSYPSFAVYDPNNQTVYILDNGTGNLTQIIQLSPNTFTTNTFSINPNGVQYGKFNSWVKGPTGEFGKDDSKIAAQYSNTLDSNGSEKFYLPSGKNYRIGSVVLRLYGDGSVSIGIGTGNYTSSKWNNLDSGFVSISKSIVKKKGEWVTVTLNSTLFLGGGKYYLNVRASPTLYWLWTVHKPSNNLQEGDLMDFHYYKGAVLSDNNTPFGYEIGFNPPTGSLGVPYPTSAAINPTSNIMYVALYGTGNVSVVNLSNDASPTIGLIQVGLLPRAIIYDALDGDLYVANSGSGTVSVISSVHFGQRSFSVQAPNKPAYPLSLAIDTGNGYVYVGNNISNNLTLENTFTSQTVNSIATGDTPTSIVYDPQNGLIYALNSASNQVTIINGGSIYFNGKSGHAISGSISGSGQIETYGGTQFVPPIGFHMQDGMVLTNYSSMKYVTSTTNVPVSFINNSGKLYLSSYLLNLQGETISSSGIGTSSMIFNVTGLGTEHYYQGEKFTYYDLYGNPYPAMITNITIFNLQYTIHSKYVNQIDQVLYNEFNGSAGGNLASWNFIGFPIHVTESGSELIIENTGTLIPFSVNFEYVGITVVNV